MPTVPERTRETIPSEGESADLSHHLPRIGDDTMARIYLKRTLSGLVAADEPSASLLRKYKVGEVYRCDIVKPRNYRHHKLCMALLNLTFENLPDKYAQSYPTFDMFRKAVALEAGHAEAFVTLQGEITSVPKSLSYDAIPDDVEFGQIMASMMTICAGILQMSAPELEEEVARYADEHYGRAA